MRRSLVGAILQRHSAQRTDHETGTGTNKTCKASRARSSSTIVSSSSVADSGSADRPVLELVRVSSVSRC